MKLTYFDLGGRAACIRMLLAHAKVDFEDCRVTGQVWADLKASGKCPNGQVPILEDEGRTYCQSTAILRYLGIKLGYYSGNDANKAYDADYAIACVDDIWNWEFVSCYFAKEAVCQEKIDMTIVKQKKLLDCLTVHLGEK